MKGFAGWWLGLLLWAGAAAGQGAPAPPTLPYDLAFEATVVPTERLVRARLRMGPNQVDRMVFRIDPERHKSLRADGKLVVDGRSATWEPPRRAGWRRRRCPTTCASRPR